MNTKFKPQLSVYGKRQKVSLKLKYLFIFMCLVTPFTNFLIPIISKAKLGSIYFMREL